MKVQLFAFSALFAGSFLACPGTPPPLPPEPPYVETVTDAGDGEADGRARVDPLCRLACENLAKLGCPEAGEDCGSVCTKAEARGNPMHPLCLANASTPDQARECKSVRCKGR